MEPVCYLNGKIIPLKDASVSILDLGVLRGFGVYDGLTAFSGEPFHFKDHWERFQKAAHALGLTIPYSSEEALGAMREVIARNAPGVRANLRMILTGGLAEGGLRHSPGRETFFIIAEPHVRLPEELYAKGGRITRHEHQRFMPEIKTTNYITAVSLQKKRLAAEAIEILYTTDSQVLECATSNIFIVKNGVLHTPDSGVLKGVTRKVVLGLASEAYPTKERPISIDELLGADEVFITGSFKDIVPIVFVDEHAIGSGKPGPITKHLMARFAAHTTEKH